MMATDALAAGGVGRRTSGWMPIAKRHEPRESAKRPGLESPMQARITP